MKIEYVRQQIQASKARSAWQRGVNTYALELLDSLEERIDYEKREPASPRELVLWLLNGAQYWQQFSEGGCALISNFDIAERLCSPSELRKLIDSRGVLKERPNARENWIECQARALFQASKLICTVWPLYVGKEVR